MPKPKLLLLSRLLIRIPAIERISLFCSSTSMYVLWEWLYQNSCWVRLVELIYPIWSDSGTNPEPSGDLCGCLSCSSRDSQQGASIRSRKGQRFTPSKEALWRMKIIDWESWDSLLGPWTIQSWTSSHDGNNRTKMQFQTCAAFRVVVLQYRRAALPAKGLITLLVSRLVKNSIKSPPRQFFLRLEL